METKTHETQVAQSEDAQEAKTAKSSRRLKKLSYRHEKFLNSYLRHGNMRRAAIDAGSQPQVAYLDAKEYLENPTIAQAVEESRLADRRQSEIDRLELLEILISMARAVPSDFTEVMKDPGNPESYCGLGSKEHAIKSLSRHKGDLKIEFVDKVKVIETIWEKLGFDKDIGARDRQSLLGELLSAVRGLSKQGKSS